MENTSTNIQWKKLAVPFILILVVLIADQYFKYWVKINMTENPVIPILGDWFKLNFTENNGMAFGLEIPGDYGKLFLTSFRIIFVFLGLYYLVMQSKKEASKGFLVCVSLIIAGALGNIIDSVFYGVWFDDINFYDGGYFHGRVVDMLHFPLVHGTYPSWFPGIGGDSFTFFSPVFNIADTAISTGVISIFVFQKRYFPHVEEKKEEAETEGGTNNPGDTASDEEE